MKVPARRRPIAIAAGAVAAVAALLVLALAAFPVGWFRSSLQRRLSDRIGAPVTIAALDRTSRLSLHPTIVIRGLVVLQPRWVGAGELARIDRAAITLAVLPLLRGKVQPTAVELSGARLALVRAADGRTNWSRSSGHDRGGGGGLPLDRLAIRDTVVRYRDLKQGREATVSVSADPSRGVAISGHGVVRGTPVTLKVAAPPPGPGAWPFRAAIAGPDLAMTATGRMAAPLDTGHMALDVTARASDLALVDAIVEAGLFGTQPVRLSAHAEHDGARWRVSDLSGRIGASTALTGRVDVVKRGDRSEIAGSVHATSLDFDDLATDAGLAEGRARQAALGPRLVPDTRINIRKIDRTDGVLDVRVDRIVGRSPSALRTLAGHLTLDHQLLTLAPLTIGLARGAIAGRVVVDQRGAPPLPLVRFDLRLSNSSVAALAGGGGGGAVTGRLDARALLVGRGGTIRDAVGASTGRIGVAARSGTLPARIADALGFDAGRALLAGHDDRSALRCAILGLDVRRGVGRVDPLVIDTGTSQLRGTGTVSFPSEVLAIRTTGAPKRDSVLRLPGAAFLRGTVEDPHVSIPPEVKSAGNILRAIGNAVTGRQGPTAEDANCPALAARVLR